MKQTNNSLHFADPTENQPADEEKIQQTKPQVVGEQSASGHMPNPEEVEENDTLDRAQDMGLYKKADESHPVELGG